MSAERSVQTQEALLARLPGDLQPLAEWGWGFLRNHLFQSCRALGVDPVNAAAMAARVARVCVTEIYNDVKAYRAMGEIRGKVLVILLVLSGAALGAQTAPIPVTPSHRLVWDQVAATLAAAQALQYFAVIDGTRSNQAVTPITCSGAASPFTCSMAMPTMTPGNHTLALVSGITVDGALVLSSTSGTLSVTMSGAPPAPLNLRAVRPGQ